MFCLGKKRPQLYDIVKYSGFFIQSVIVDSISYTFITYYISNIPNESPSNHNPSYHCTFKTRFLQLM